VKWLLLAPAAAFALAFTAAPLATVAHYSLLKVDFINNKFVGFANYVKALSDPVFLRSWLNSGFYIVLTVGVGVGTALTISLVTYPLEKRWHDAVRIVFYVPVLSAGMIIAQAWRWIFNSAGPVNWLIEKLGGEPIAFFMRQATAIPAISLIVITSGLGGTIIILLAGILGIDKSLFDAATIDGASSFQIKARIVVPALRPLLALVSFVAMIGGLQIFETIYSLAPYEYTATVTFHIYREAFVFGRYGLASAQAIILLIIAGALTAIKRRIERS
jgi:multiple sugar transport system permease protein